MGDNGHSGEPVLCKRMRLQSTLVIINFFFIRNVDLFIFTLTGGNRSITVDFGEVKTALTF